jgi:hypothetical protein
MSDIDPNKIPTLNDIIDDDTTDDTVPDTVENESSLDLFENEETDKIFDTDPEIGTEDESIDKIDTDKEITLPSTPYTYEETYNDSAYQLDYEVTYEDLITYDDLVEFNQNTPIEPLEVELIVKSVVKQMMPDLEQQLRFLIQQALEKQLPPEIVKSPKDDARD